MTMGTPSSAGDVVAAFIAAQSTQDTDQAMPYVSPNIVFENVPFPPGHETRGDEQLRAAMGVWMTTATRVKWTILRQMVDGEHVLHERVDEFWYPEGLFPGGDYCAFRVAAAWHVRDGLIDLWRDYYDLAVIRNSLGVELAEYSQIKRDYLARR
jgi:limonene-1,2-epoxide hydrolase